VNDQPAEVTVTLGTDGSTRISLTPTERPVEVLRTTASLLERYAATIERENEPLSCGTCGATPTGVRAVPDGQWRFTPCGHGLVVDGG
jgi:hypothetical protein